LAQAAQVILSWELLAHRIQSLLYLIRMSSTIASRHFWLAVAFWQVLLLVQVQFGYSQEDAAADKANDENDPTKQLLSQLTIGMMEVVDERTVAMRHTSRKEGKSKKVIHLRLGNVGAPERGSLSDDEYATKVKAATAALSKLVDKQALWYKAAPDNVQPPSSADDSPDLIIGDLWNKGGRHINTAMKKEGHLTDVKEYESEIAKDILGEAAKEAKEEAYKKLGQAFQENEDAKRAEDKKNKATMKDTEAEEAAAEGMGMGGWIGIALVVALLVGVATNFGQASNKKTNLNRKKGFMEKLFAKLKGA